jgi:hypothetical protein
VQKRIIKTQVYLIAKSGPSKSQMWATLLAHVLSTLDVRWWSSHFQSLAQKQHRSQIIVKLSLQWP